MCYTGKSYGVFTFSEFLFQIFSEQISMKEKGLTNWCFGPQLVLEENNSLALREVFDAFPFKIHA